MTQGRARPAHVLIAGGGVAGIEAVLALRAFACESVRLTVLDPGRRFTVPGTATGQAFGMGAGVDLRLADAVDRAGAELVSGSLRSVDAGRGLATLDGGRVMRFDALIVAVGAKAVAAVPGALTFTGSRDVEALRGLVDDVVIRVRRGARVELSVVVPPGCGWPLPAYELALMTREYLAQAGAMEVGIEVVTAELEPLDIFGPEAVGAVSRSLRRAGIALRAGVTAVGWDAGCLDLADGSALLADRVVALPVYRGPAIGGLPADELGFIPTGPDGAVEGRPGVWAVGDGTTLPIKQGGVACRQADVAAAAAAAALGVAPVDPGPLGDGPAGWLWDGRRGCDLPPHGEAAAGCGAGPRTWPVAKVDGRFLTPFLYSLAATGRLPAEPVRAPA